MAKPVILESRKFATKKAASDFVRDQILYGYDLDQVVSDPDHHQLLLELNERHKDAEEKKGVGIREFFIRKTEAGDFRPVSANARGIWIRRTDGSEVDWSYLTAIQQPGPRVNIKDALRLAVNDRRIAFRSEKFAAGPVLCALTGVLLKSKDEADVIYRGPTWDVLVEGFVDTQGGWANVETNSGFGETTIGGRVSDSAVEQAWLAYHAENARLLIVKSDEGGKGSRR